MIFISLEGVDGDAVPIAFADGKFDVRKGKTTRLALIAYAKTKAEECGVPVRWIVIDRLARGMAGGNENSADFAKGWITSSGRRTPTSAWFGLVERE